MTSTLQSKFRNREDGKATDPTDSGDGRWDTKKSEFGRDLPLMLRGSSSFRHPPSPRSAVDLVCLKIAADDHSSVSGSGGPKTAETEWQVACVPFLPWTGTTPSLDRWKQRLKAAEFHARWPANACARTNRKTKWRHLTLPRGQSGQSGGYRFPARAADRS